MRKIFKNVVLNKVLYFAGREWVQALNMHRFQITHFFLPKSTDNFFYFYMKTYVVGTDWKYLSKVLLMCFCGEIKKIFHGRPLYLEL